MMVLSANLFKFLLLLYLICPRLAQDYGGGNNSGGDEEEKRDLPKSFTACNGVFLMYTYESRERLYPFLRNASAQAYAFKATALIVNTGKEVLKNWAMFIGFQHQETLVTLEKAVLINGSSDLPANVGKGAVIAGDPSTDLKMPIETAGDWNQFTATINMKGTQLGVKPPGVPMPRSIRLANEGFKCPGLVRRKTEQHVCCTVDTKFRKKKPKKKDKQTKFDDRRDGDLVINYDVLQAYPNNYFAQVTIDNRHPLGRLDNWNLTWQWRRGEFIYSMKGAYTHIKDPSECIYGPPGQYYQEFDFTPVLNCQRKPSISDLPPDRAKDEKIGNIPFCCRNGSLLPPTMNETKSKSAFQLQVFKVPPDLNRTALFPPQGWKITGVMNPNYVCSAPRRVSPTQFPDSSGLDMVNTAIASWQVVCNINKPKHRESRCCVSFSAFYNDSVIPCNTCACGCDEVVDACNPDARSMLLPPEALLVPFDYRAAKAKAWAKIKHYKIPRPLPCADNCGVSINWHINSDARGGWTARMTLFNWQSFMFEDWFAAIQIPKAYRGFEAVYSFNGTRMPELNNTIFFQGLPGLNYLIAEANGTNPESDPPVPGKQQSVISFKKKFTPRINIPAGDGFPTKIYFNGEECQLPTRLPKPGAAYRPPVSLPLTIFFTVMAVFITMEYIC